VKKINGPTCKLTLCDIIIENFSTYNLDELMFNGCNSFNV